jgi:hypothetical protein
MIRSTNSVQRPTPNGTSRGAVATAPVDPDREQSTAQHERQEGKHPRERRDRDGVVLTKREDAERHRPERGRYVVERPFYCPIITGI